jgi:alanine racemase
MTPDAQRDQPASVPGPDTARGPAPDQELSFQIRSGHAPRPAWVEIDLGQLRRNFALINQDKPAGLALLSVVKDNAYGHGAEGVAREAVAAGAVMLGVNTLQEGIALRNAGLTIPILVVGERHPDELPFCIQHGLTVSVGDLRIARLLDRLAQEARCCVPVHLKVDTGMSRFGIRWDTAADAATEIRRLPGLVLEGMMSHFAMSDEADKAFALQQLSRFEQVLAALTARQVRLRYRHLCNTGGFLDLPQAHFDLVRLGILPLGVYPSQVCRRILGLQPAMTVKAKLVTVRTLQPGDTYGYGMRYQAASPRRIGVLPVGYGDGYPRLRNEGAVLVRGKRAPIIGGVAMDAIGVDLTDIPEARLWDEAVLMGRQGVEEISAHDIAQWGRSVSYDVLAGWRARLPRIQVEEGTQP